MNFKISDYNTCFWDFDGVIKESVDIKTDSYFSLFKNFGLDVAEKVKKHHLSHGGMSRFDKFPVYLSWAGIEPTENSIKSFCNEFSQLVVQRVIDSPWVKGAEEFIVNNKYNQSNILVSATPQDELEYIIDALNLTKSFLKIYGSPLSKSKALFQTMQNLNLKASECLMIGDANIDLDAAITNQISFLLRKHAGNSLIFNSYNGPHFEDFYEL